MRERPLYVVSIFFDLNIAQKRHIPVPDFVVKQKKSRYPTFFSVNVFTQRENAGLKIS
jgi:hypothetical protein